MGTSTFLFIIEVFHVVVCWDFSYFMKNQSLTDLKYSCFFFCLSALTGSQVKSFYDSDERPMAVCEFSGFVAVESKILV